MGWSKFDDRRHTNDKLLAAGVENPMKGLAANGLDANGITYCSANETDGFIKASALIVCAPGLTARQRKDLTDLLVRVGRWTHDEERGGWWIHDFLDYHPTHLECEERREADRLRKAGQKRGADGQFKAENPAGIQAESAGNPEHFRSDSNGVPTVPIPSHPDPSHPDPREVLTSPNNCNPVDPQNGDQPGAESSTTGDELQLRDVIERLRAVCTATNRDTVDRESTVVAAQCLQHASLEVIAAAVADLEGWTNPVPVLPRSLIEPFKIQCRQRGLPAPLIKVGDFVKRAS